MDGHAVLPKRRPADDPETDDDPEATTVNYDGPYYYQLTVWRRNPSRSVGACSPSEVKRKVLMPSHRERLLLKPADPIYLVESFPLDVREIVAVGN